MTVDSECQGNAGDIRGRIDALFAALEGLLRLEKACKDDYGSRRDSDGRGLFIDAKYTALWLAFAIPHLREALANRSFSGKDLAAEVLGRLSSLRNEETPEYGWRHVVRVVGETLGLDEQTREIWASKPRGS